MVDCEQCGHLLGRALGSIGLNPQTHGEIKGDAFAVLGFINCGNQALADWMQHCLMGSWPVVCVDNGAHLHDMACDVLRLEKNNGWGGGVNVLMRYALERYPQAKAVWVCNDDIFGAGQQMAASLLQVMLDHACALVTPSVEGPGNKGLWSKDIGSLFCLSFADMVCPMISTKAWQDVGELDVWNIGVGHGLDIDWCYRAKQKAYRILRHDGLKVWHPHPLTTCTAQGTIADHAVGWRERLEKKWGMTTTQLAEGFA